LEGGGVFGDWSNQRFWAERLLSERSWSNEEDEEDEEGGEEDVLIRGGHV
jgi:hypothetical protein